MSSSLGSSSPKMTPQPRIGSAAQQRSLMLSPSALSTASPSTPVHSAPASPGMHSLSLMGNTFTGGSPAVLSNAKARKAVREAEERAVREAASEEVSLQAYNAMLKKLLNKEIANREAQEAKVAELTETLERVRGTEMDALRASHAAALIAQAETLTAQTKSSFDTSLEAQVNERVAAARAMDSAKFLSLQEIQHRIHVEFEDKYAQKLQRAEREKKEMNEKLVALQARVDALTAEQKAHLAVLEHRDGMVLALEYRCAQLEKLKCSLRSYRHLIKYMSCRVFVNTVRLKRSLHGVYDSLKVLHEKLSANKDYDRSSECILPQHELECWLVKAEKLVSKPKPPPHTALGGFTAAFTNVATNLLPQGSATSLSPSSSDSASSPQLRPHRHHAAATEQAATMHPNTRTMQTADAALKAAAAVIQHDTTVSIAADAVSTFMPSLAGGAGASGAGAGSIGGSPRTRARRAGPRRTSSFLLLDDASAKLAAMDRDDRTSSSSSSSGGSGRPIPRLGYSLNFKEMLSTIGEVEFVLRGCLVECLSKASEWKAGCEGFFARDQELVGENLGLRDQVRRQALEAQHLQEALAVLQKSMGAASDERKAIMEIQAQAPGKGAAGMAGHSHHHRHHQSSSRQHHINNAAAKLRLTASARDMGGPDQNGFDRDVIARGVDIRSGATLLTSAALNANAADASSLPHPNKGSTVFAASPRSGSGGGTGSVGVVGEVTHADQALSLIEQHKRSQRLAAIDGTSGKDLHSLSASELAELSRTHSKLSGPKGFFDHHNALMQCCMGQKLELERLQRGTVALRSQNLRLKAKLREARQAQEFAYEVGQTMDGEVGQVAAAEEEALATAAAAASPGAAVTDVDDEPNDDDDGDADDMREEHKESSSAVASAASSPRNNTQRERKVRRVAGGGGGGNRPGSLDVEHMNSNSNSSNTNNTQQGPRSLIPFSPPVGPVSPWLVTPPTTAGSTGPSSTTGTTGGLAALSSSPYASTIRGPGLSMSIPGAASSSNGGGTTRPSTSGSGGSGGSGVQTYATTPLRGVSHSAQSQQRGPRVSPGAMLLASSLQSPSSGGPAITTSSASYAGTNVYTPASHLYSAAAPHHGHYGTPHQASKAPALVYGHANSASSPPEVTRPRTGPSGAGRSAAAAAQRTINPLLAAGLVPASSVAAALVHARGALALHPSLQITNDVRYDIISPYVAQPLPWEKKNTAAAGPSSSVIYAAPISPASRDPSSSLPATERRKSKGSSASQQERRASREAQRVMQAQQEVFERPFQPQPPQTSQQQQQQQAEDLQPQAPPSSARVPSAPRGRPFVGGVDVASPAPPLFATAAASSEESTPAASPSNSNSSRGSGGGVGGVKKVPIIPPSASSSSSLSPTSFSSSFVIPAPTPTPPPPRPSAPSPAASDSSSAQPSPLTGYRSVIAGSGRPAPTIASASIAPHHHSHHHDQLPPRAASASSKPQRVSLDQYADDAFDQSPEDTGHTVTVTLAARNDDNEEYEMDDDMIRDEDMRRDGSAS